MVTFPDLSRADFLEQITNKPAIPGWNVDDCGMRCIDESSIPKVPVDESLLGENHLSNIDYRILILGSGPLAEIRVNATTIIDMRVHGRQELTSRSLKLMMLQSLHWMGAHSNRFHVAVR
jgi:hypothetical protein